MVAQMRGFLKNLAKWSEYKFKGANIGFIITYGHAFGMFQCNRQRSTRWKHAKGMSLRYGVVFLDVFVTL